MALSSDFIEARKVSLSALTGEESVVREKKVVSTTEEVFEEQEEQEYIPTHSLLAVRNVAFSTLEEEERFTVKEQEPKSVNEKLYAEAIEGKEDTEREKKKEALLDHRG